MSGQRKAILTGATSFIGVHLAQAFARAGWDVVGTHGRDIGAYNEVQRQRLEVIRDVIRLQLLDIRNATDVSALAERERPDVWIQQAGHATNCGSVDYDCAASLAINVAPLQPLFLALKGSSCGVILTGSDAEYGISDKAHSEEDDTRPSLPYGVCKLAATQLACQQSAHYGVPVRVARVYIPIGALDNPHRLLMAAVRALKEGRRVDLSPCTQRRDFAGVADVARAYVLLADDMARGGFDIFNVSSGEALELAELLKKLARILDADESLLRFGTLPLRPGEPLIAFGNPAKARSQLGWQARPIEQALREDLLGQSSGTFPSRAA